MSLKFPGGVSTVATFNSMNVLENVQYKTALRKLRSTIALRSFCSHFTNILEYVFDPKIPVLCNCVCARLQAGCTPQSMCRLMFVHSPVPVSMPLCEKSQTHRSVWNFLKRPSGSSVFGCGLVRASPSQRGAESFFPFAESILYLS